MTRRQRLELTWIGKDERPDVEPRIFIEDAEMTYHAATRRSDGDIYDNMLINGDNLLALKALEQQFVGKIKCVFIDPPYNTGSAFEHYSDGVEHSLWLSMIRDRLECIWRLVREDGSLWITIDDNEAHYLKVLCDELFGRSSFIATNVWQKRYSRENREAIGDAHDYVLVYAKQPETFKKTRNLLPLGEKQKGVYRNPDNDHRGAWQSVSLLAQGYRPNQMYKIVSPSGKVHEPPAGTCWKVIESEYQKLLADNRVYFGKDGNGVPRRKEFLEKAKGLVPWTWWPHEEAGHNDEAKREIHALFGKENVFDTPKPERLLHRVIQIATNPGDIVLDSFAGSGTTGAVAHKMGRRWIMVELGEHCHTHIIPRLRKVIDGADPGGITEAVDWIGGGGFRYYRLAPSLLEKDRWGNWIISQTYNPTMLAEAVCKLMGFAYAPSDTHYCMLSSKQRKYKVISLFSGAMGLDIGLEKTGRFEIIACVEKERSFCDTIRANHKAGRLSPDLKIFEGDISDIDPHEVLKACGLEPGELDLLVGGSPCQAFSTAGRRRTVQDPRGSLLWQFLRFVDVLNPRFFLMENVRGLLSAALNHRSLALRPERGGRPLEPDEQAGSVVRLFADDLEKLPGSGYHMDCFEVNAVNYGAPQLRERVLFIGNRFNSVVDFPNPTHGQATPSSDAQTHLFAQDGLQPWKTLRDAIGHLDDPGSVMMDFSPRKKSFLAHVPPGSNWRSLPTELQQESMGVAWHAKGGRSGWWRRLSFDLPCPTLVTMPNHASTALCHPTELRALSLKEYSLIQEFPTDWEFCGSPMQQYAQVGNAVPVRLGQVAGDVIAEQLDGLASRDWSAYETKPPAYRIVYVQSHVRTRQWFKAGKTFVWEDGQNNAHAAYERPQTLRRVTAL